MATEITLAEAIEQVIDAVDARLTAALPTALSELNDIIVGDRARVGFDLPVLWIMAETATNVEQHALQETWELPIALVAVVKGDEPETAARQAQTFAAAARSVVLAYDDDKRYRRLNLSFVDDVQSREFEPARDTQLDNTLLYSAAAVVTVRFRVFERP